MCASIVFENRSPDAVPDSVHEIAPRETARPWFFTKYSRRVDSYFGVGSDFFFSPKCRESCRIQHQIINHEPLGFLDTLRPPEYSRDTAPESSLKEYELS